MVIPDIFGHPSYLYIEARSETFARVIAPELQEKAESNKDLWLGQKKHKIRGLPL